MPLPPAPRRNSGCSTLAENCACRAANRPNRSPSSNRASPGSRTTSAALYVSSDYGGRFPNQYHDYGLGVPLIATLSKNAAAQNGYYVRELGFPVTAFLRFDGGLADVEHPGAARLELYDPKTIEAATLGGKTVPLESDLTTPPRIR